MSNYAIGDRYSCWSIHDEDTPEKRFEALLAQVGESKCALIRLDTGNRLQDPVWVYSPFKMSDEELAKTSRGFHVERIKRYGGVVRT